MTPEVMLTQATQKLTSKMPAGFAWKQTESIARLRTLQRHCESDEALLNRFVEEVCQNPKAYTHLPTSCEKKVSSAPRTHIRDQMMLNGSKLDPFVARQDEPTIRDSAIFEALRPEIFPVQEPKRRRGFFRKLFGRSAK